MLNTIFFYHTLRVSSWIESSSKNFIKFFIKTTNSQLLKIHIFLKNLFLFHSICCNFQSIFIFWLAKELCLLLTLDKSISQSRFNINRCDFFYCTNQDQSFIKQRKCKFFILIGKHAFVKLTNCLSNNIFIQNDELAIIRKFQFGMSWCPYLLFYYYMHLRKWV